MLTSGVSVDMYGWAFQSHEMFGHDPEVMGSAGPNLRCVVLVLVGLWAKNIKCQCSNLSESMWQFISFERSMVAQWLGWASQGQEMCYQDQKVMGLNPGRVKLCVCSLSVRVRHLNQKETYILVANIMNYNTNIHLLQMIWIHPTI